jgi:carbamoylphosphate synthase small subunit
MSPYQTNVTDAAIREAKKQADIQKNANAMSSIGRGTFGSGREALMTGEADAQTRALIADLRAQGQEKAFLNAQSQFERDRAAGMTAEEKTLQWLKWNEENCNNKVISMVQDYKKILVLLGYKLRWQEQGNKLQLEQQIKQLI